MTSRIDALRVLMTEHDIGALYVSHSVNVRYLSGFTGSNGALLVPRDGAPLLITDGRYRNQARDELSERVPDAAFAITRDLAGEARGRGATHAETHRLTVDAWRALGEPASSGPLVEELRVVKDDIEITHLSEACRISGRALEQLLAGQLDGRTEVDIARDLERRMIAEGADGIAFDTILASGDHTAIPHHSPTDRVVRRGDFLKIDFGAEVAGYRADCTRTVVIGTASDWQREVYGVVKAAQQAGLDALVPGAPLGEAHAAATNVLRDAGWLENFTTGLGHGVGLEIHEDPYFSAGATARLKSRTILTMEPGVYVPGRGGVRIEDTVLVAESDDSAATDPASGAMPRLLTTPTKELLEIN